MPSGRPLAAGEALLLRGGFRAGVRTGWLPLLPDRLPLLRDEAAAAASLKSVEAKLRAANSALESHRTRELSPLVSPTKPERSPARRFSGGTGTTDEELLSARNAAAEARSELDKERILRVKAVSFFFIFVWEI